METKNEEKQEKSQLQKIKPKAIIALLIIFGFLIGWEIGIRAYAQYIRPYFQGRAYQNAVDAYIQAQINDFTGGSTPEETVDMFIEALKKRDMNLASKYFIIDDQEKWLKTFTEMKNAGRGQGLIDELENAKKIWRTEKQGEDKYVIKYNTGTGEEEITNFIVLKKNVNNKWKIASF